MTESARHNNILLHDTIFPFSVKEKNEVTYYLTQYLATLDRFFASYWMFEATLFHETNFQQDV